MGHLARVPLHVLLIATCHLSGESVAAGWLGATTFSERLQDRGTSEHDVDSAERSVAPWKGATLPLVG